MTGLTSNPLEDMLSSGISLFGQGARILVRWRTKAASPKTPYYRTALLAKESLSQLYRYTLDCLSVDTHLELKGLLGQPIEVAILLPEGGERLLTVENIYSCPNKQRRRRLCQIRSYD